MATSGDNILKELGIELDFISKDNCEQYIRGYKLLLVGAEKQQEEKNILLYKTLISELEIMLENYKLQ